MERFIPLSVPNLKGNELIYITDAIKEEWVSTAGAYINQFEQKIAAYVGTAGAVACQSGTAGLHLALLACGVKEGEEVIVPTLTFVAAVNPVKYVGAEPIFMDCDNSLTMDPRKLKMFFENECKVIGGNTINKKTGKKVSAIVVVHVFGNMADMEQVCKLALQYRVKVIEDATEALGTYYTRGSLSGHYAGTLGDIGVFSFNGNKIITTGGGGMVVSNSKEMLERCRYLSTQAKDDLMYFDHQEIGYNYRMTNVQAAIGIAQLEQLENFITIKEKNYKRYQSEGIELFPFREGIRPNYWFYSYLTEKRDELINHLSNVKIQARPVWKLIHMLKPYENCQTYQIEKAQEYYNQIVNIPCSSNLLEEDILRVAMELIRFKEK